MYGAEWPVEETIPAEPVAEGQVEEFSDEYFDYKVEGGNLMFRPRFL